MHLGPAVLVSHCGKAEEGPAVGMEVRSRSGRADESETEEWTREGWDDSCEEEAWMRAGRCGEEGIEGGRGRRERGGQMRLLSIMPHVRTPSVGSALAR